MSTRLQPKARLVVKIAWAPPLGFILSAKDEHGLALEASRIARHLLTWDPASFYGTHYQQASVDAHSGVVVGALTACDYFPGDMANSLLEIQWPPEYDAIRKAAEVIRAALRAPGFAPDFEAWSQGLPGWRLCGALGAEIQSAADRIGYFSEWLNLAVSQHIAAHRDLEELWEGLKLDYPLLTSSASGLQRKWDETEWLVANGFQEDTWPFRTCLQLEESAESPEFILRPALQDRHNPSLLIPLPLSESALAEMLDPEYASRVLRNAAHWKVLVPWLEAPAMDKDAVLGIRQTLRGDEPWRFLTDAAPILAEAGYTLILPAWWDQVRNSRARLRAHVKSPAGSKSASLFGLNQTVAFDWRIAVGDAEITPEEFAELVSKKSRLVQFRNQWLCIDPEFLRQMRKAMKSVGERGLSFRDVLTRYLQGSGGDSQAPAESGEEPLGEAGADSLDYLELVLDTQMREMIQHLETKETLPINPAPPGFHGTLRAYQQAGFSWLIFLRRHGLGALLADDMGLGKTVQYIAYLLHVRTESERSGWAAEGESDRPSGPALLICPTSVLGNWQKELEKFAPSLQVHLHYGASRLHSEALLKKIGQVDLVVTSYALALIDVEDLAAVHWNSLCLDEAQNIKNPHTKQAMAVRRIGAGHKIAMTGTPVENRLAELWSLMDFANPGYLGRAASFARTFAKPIEQDPDSLQARQLQRLVKPFLLRRIKEDPAVGLDLPEKSEMKEFVSLSPEQAALYESTVQHMLERIDQEPPMARRGVILATLTRLKQTCNHPALALQDTPEDSTVLGKNVSRQIARSAKLERLVEMVQEVREEGSRCLIFTQFVQAGLLIQACLREILQEPVSFLHGSLSKTARDQMIAGFQQATGGPGVLLLSLKAGGVGLNLTAASHVFHFDRWWNPAVESQATDRAYRIGQHQHVQVHKFVTLGTLEERIDALLESKLSLSQNIVGTDERWITELGTDELRELLMLRREWLRD